MLCRTGHSLDDVGRKVSWPDFCAFLKMLPPDSALYRELHEDRAAWDAGYVDAHLIASLIDETRALRYVVECAFSKQAPPKPDMYPRPWKQNRRDHREFDAAKFREKLKKYEEM